MCTLDNNAFHQNYFEPITIIGAIKEIKNESIFFYSFDFQ
jgi:hypothetical protein